MKMKTKNTAVKTESVREILEKKFNSLEWNHLRIDFSEWIASLTVIKEDLYQYDLESSYIIFSRVFKFENDFYEIFRTQYYDGETYGTYDKFDLDDIRLLEECEVTTKEYKVVKY